MARKLLTMDGRYDRAAIVRRANYEFRAAREIGLDWDRAYCLAYVWRQARTLHAAFHGRAETPVRPRKKPVLNAPARSPCRRRQRVGEARS